MTSCCEGGTVAAKAAWGDDIAVPAGIGPISGVPRETTAFSRAEPPEEDLFCRFDGEFEKELMLSTVRFRDELFSLSFCIESAISCFKVEIW
jgi:hypothetical protein